MKQQLAIEFKPKANPYDVIVRELEAQLTGMKWHAMKIDMFVGKDSPALHKTLEIVRDYGNLCAELSPRSDKYKNLTGEVWKRRSSYEPYYAPVDERSTLDLYETTLDYKRRSKAIYVRLERLAEIPSEYSKLIEKYEEVAKILKRGGY